MINSQSKQKKRSKKPLYILLVFISVFSIFIYVLLKPSLEATAINEINSCRNIEDVKSKFDKYKEDLITSEDFCQATRDILNSFSLKQQDIIEIKKWLPSKTDNLNIIIVPDLSNRIIDPINNPEQVKRDSVIIDAICQSFEKKVKLKMNSKDRLIIDVTDRNQAGGKIGELADSLKLSLDEIKDRSNRLYFDSHINQFKTSVKKLYDEAFNFEIKHPTGGGADYVSYFSTNLKQKIQKSTLDDNYNNILIILTDGYLEATKPNGKVINYLPNDLCKSYSDRNQHLIDETINTKFKNLNVFVLEVNRKKGSSDCDEKGLQKWWANWLKSMNIKNITDDTLDDEIIIKRTNGYNDVIRKVDEIINIK